MPNDTRPCYYRNGKQSDYGVPCTGDKHTFCCAGSDVCLSNGLCMNTGHQPYVLSRGSCTNQAWDQGCPQYCMDVNPSGGCSIINLLSTDDITTYCCGTPVSNGSAVVCPDGSNGFQIPDGNPVEGRALLNYNASSSSSSPQSSRDMALGVGVGVPLGVVALATTAWAVLERRRAKQVRHVQLPPVPAQAMPYEVSKPPLVELEHVQPRAEIMGEERLECSSHRWD